MPDVCRAGGFSETLRIGHLAAAHQVALSPHMIHEICCTSSALPNGFLFEYMTGRRRTSSRAAAVPRAAF